jgi:exosome complex component RRP46
MASISSKTALNTLDGPDGSATYNSNGYTVIAAVNGPIEVSRRDEMPEEATLEVNVRPAIGVGGMFTLQPLHDSN